MAKKTTGKAAHRKAEAKAAIEQRRVKVAVALLQGLTYREIARALDVSIGTVSSDRRAIVREWRKHYTEKTDDWIEIQLRRLDVLLNAIWDDAQKGSLKHIDRVLKLIERQERLLGIGAGSGAQWERKCFA